MCGFAPLWFLFPGPLRITTPIRSSRTSICVNECPRRTEEEAGGPSTVPRTGLGGAPGWEVGPGLGTPHLHFVFL